MQRNHENNGHHCLIEKMPQELLGHIISFLPTKEAVRTCILSTKWTNTWTILNRVDLDDSTLTENYIPICYLCKSNCKSFCYEIDNLEGTVCTNCYDYAGMNVSNRRCMDIDVFTNRKVVWDRRETEYISGVSRVILATKNLQEFSLVIHNRREENYHNTWIFGLLNKGIKIISIISLFYPLPLSRSTTLAVFNSDSLTNLTLNLHKFSSLKIPESMDLKNLRILKLFGIVFSGSRILKLPVLKEICLTNCIWTDGQLLIVKAPQLENVYVQQDANIDSLTFLHDQLDLSIQFETSCLKQFIYSGFGVLQKIHLPPRQRYSAVVTFQQCNWRVFKVEEHIPFLFMLLQGFTSVKDIHIEGMRSEVLKKAKETKMIPEFSMKTLKLISVSTKVIFFLMEKSPTLEHLVLKGIRVSEEDLNGFEVPYSLHSSLKEVKFEAFNNSDECKLNLILAEYFLKHGMMLEKMHFSQGGKNTNTHVEKKLTELVNKYKQDPHGFSLTLDD
ncbi:hypothetical protein TSUD_204620 [Trifolium subterraneum]|uniref:F-box domain-containing protein n=1 Tax=Trifolium subterraneum TaxID=3900 RepID=A0A2Z6MBY4_TRISU|nr:hypothetical protein TSUD_204620 [Trifolium subterraneum]